MRLLMEPLLCHGILRQRQLDLLTDTFRAQLLRLAGYRCGCVSGRCVPRPCCCTLAAAHKPPHPPPPPPHTHTRQTHARACAHTCAPTGRMWSSL
jgi:hypothetical protein